MSSISSINTNIYSGLIESRDAVSGRNAPEVAKVPTFSSSDVDNSKVDIENYYSNIRPEDVYANMGANVAKSAENLDNAMVSAVASGYSVNDAMKIQMAKHAYEANVHVYESAIEVTV